MKKKTTYTLKYTSLDIEVVGKCYVAMGKGRMLPWQTMSTFIFSFISSQILSKAHKYWVCGVFLIFAVLSFLLKIEHIFSVKWYINWYIFKNLYQ